jgi:hypothetical protein
VTRRVRASFLLRCVLLAAKVAVGLAIVALSWWLGLRLVAIGLVLAVLVVDEFALSGGSLLERLVTRRARRSARPVRSVWFVDLDDQDDRERADFQRLTEDNPTLR